MYEPLDRFFKRLNDITARFYQIKVDENEPDLSPHMVELYEALAVAVESLHTAESELRQQQEQMVEAQQVAVLEQERYYELFNGAPDAYLVTNAYGVIQEANHAAARLLNISAKYLKGKPMALYIVPEERAAFRTFTHLLATSTSSQSLKEEFSFQSRHFALPIAVAATVVPIQNHKGHVVGFRWLLRDISQRRYYQAQLQNSNQLLLSLIDASPLGIVAVDHEARVQMWNHAAERLLGWHRAEVIAEVTPYLVLAEMSASWDALIQKGIQIEHHEMETEFRHKDGSLIPVRLFLAPLEDSNGTRTGIITLIADLRDEVRHRADMRTIKSRLTATRDSERRRIARDLHDDVIQQLVGLQFQLVHFRNLTLTPTEPHLETVQLGLSRMGSDMGAIVRLVRAVIAGLRPPGLEAFGLKRALEAYTAHTQQTWHDSAPQIALQVPDEDLELPMAVATVLLRVTQEALRNVHRHAEAQQVGVVLTYTEAEVSLEVQDDGKGFDCPARLSDLAHEAHFGLLGVAEQVESVGGVLRLASQPGQGTTMKVTIPLAENLSAAEAVT